MAKAWETEGITESTGWVHGQLAQRPWGAGSGDFSAVTVVTEQQQHGASWAERFSQQVGIAWTGAVFPQAFVAVHTVLAEQAQVKEVGTNAAKRVANAVARKIGPRIAAMIDILNGILWQENVRSQDRAFDFK